MLREARELSSKEGFLAARPLLLQAYELVMEITTRLRDAWRDRDNTREREFAYLLAANISYELGEYEKTIILVRDGLRNASYFDGALLDTAQRAWATWKAVQLAVERADLLHKQAMLHYDVAVLSKQVGDDAKYQEALRLAYEKEREAAEQLENTKVQPSRSVLYRSAAEMALQLGKTDEAIELATQGLSQCFHEELRQELLDVLERARRTTRIGGE